MVALDRIVGSGMGEARPVASAPTSCASSGKT